PRARGDRAPRPPVAAAQTLHGDARPRRAALARAELLRDRGPPRAGAPPLSRLPRGRGLRPRLPPARPPARLVVASRRDRAVVPRPDRLRLRRRDLHAPLAPFWRARGRRSAKEDRGDLRPREPRDRRDALPRGVGEEAQRPRLGDPDSDR